MRTHYRTYMRRQARPECTDGMTHPSQASSTFSTGTPLVSGRQRAANSVFRITQPAKKRNTPYCTMGQSGHQNCCLGSMLRLLKKTGRLLAAIGRLHADHSLLLTYLC